jgi:oxygen-independent coproporphyrinogen-3 oxidase
MTIDSLRGCIGKKSNASLGIYIHIPFCRVRCQFCAFYVQTHREEKVEAFLVGLNREIRRYAGEMGFDNIPVSSVYFGGGTPTVLSSRQLVQVLDEIRKWFRIMTDAEISVEAHPGTVHRESLDVLRSQGFNRLSLGAQSFDDQELRQLGGRSVSRKTQTAMESARQAGFDNISLDLMYGFPGQTFSSWEQSLVATMPLAPTHLSCYAFTVEEGSHIYDRIDQGTAFAPDETVQASLGNFAVEYLNFAGYEQYEISNFCQPGFACKHNLRYWQGKSYLGLGPSSQSFVSGVRFGNVADLEFYGLALAQGELPLEHWEVLRTQEIQRERIVFGLRTREGVLLEHVRSLTGQDVEWARAFSELKDQGLLAEDDEYVRLTGKGVLFADTVAVALI